MTLLFYLQINPLQHNCWCLISLSLRHWPIHYRLYLSINHIGNAKLHYVWIIDWFHHQVSINSLLMPILNFDRQVQHQCLNESHLAGSSLNHWLIRLRLSNIMSIWITLLMPISFRSRFDMFLRFSKTSNPFLRKLSWYWGRFILFSHSPTGCAC